VAGAANNQLQTEEDGIRLEERGIVYAPDYIINAGGVINIADELYGYDRERALKKVDGIYDNIVRVFEIARRDGIPSFQAANRLAEERIESIKRSRKQFLPHSRHILTNR
jgi:leucine dehydrogenase